MAELNGTNGAGRPRWDNRISFGSVLTAISMLLAAGGVYAAKTAEIATIRAELAHLERQQDEADARSSRVNAEQDARWQLLIADLKGDIRDLRQQIDHALQQHRP
jgi:predicted negative regulator of RcsB-dependent stress response